MTYTSREKMKVNTYLLNHIIQFQGPTFYHQVYAVHRSYINLVFYIAYHILILNFTLFTIQYLLFFISPYDIEFLGSII